MLKFTSVLLSCFFLFTIPFASAQKGIPDKIGANVHRGPSMHSLENKAKKSFEEGNYFLAMKYYQNMLDNDSLNIVALEGMAESAIAYTNYFKALETYEYMLRHGLLQEDASTFLRLAKVQFLLRHYSDAKQLYQRANDRAPSEAAQRGIADCDWAMKQKEEITLDAVGKDVNTVYAEYSNVWDNGTFYYSSYSKPYKRDSSRLLIQILEARVYTDSSLFIRPSSFNEENKHTAYLTFNTDKSVMYYAVGDFVKEKQIRFDLYRRKRSGGSDWGPAEKLPATINMEGVTTTQPHICRLPGEQEETLFFVSDRPGGKGKKDIWFSRIKDGVFNEPVNLFALNTAEDDVTPFFQDSTQTLFFSSTGHRPSLGGFDVYSSKYNSSGWSAPEHMPAEINSSGNDVFYSIYQLPHVAQIAFFSSNRYGAQNISEEECCYDIFKYRRPILYICNEEIGVALNNASITLLELTSAGPVELSRLTLPGSTHPLPLLPGKSYLLITSKPGFHTDTLRLDSPQKIWDQHLTIERCLRPAKVDLLVEVMEMLGGDTLVPLPGATLEFNTLSRKLPSGEMDRGPDGKGLAALKNTLAENLNTQQYDTLLFEHNYELKGSKIGYTGDSTLVSTLGFTGDTSIHRVLRLRKGFNLDVYVYDDLTGDSLYDVSIALYEINPDRVRIDSVFTGPNANDYHTIIHYDTRYFIKASKEGYTSDSAIINTLDLEKIPFRTIIQELFLRPLDPRKYLPIVLYFDNDEPGPHVRGVTTTKEQYRDTYFKFYPKKKEFIDSYIAPLTGEQRELDSLQLDRFFEDSVKAGWDRLFKFSEVLYTFLNRGDQITIQIRGYASPLASSEYNLALTGRRVDSVMKHFKEHDEFNYDRFTGNGQLKMPPLPFGSSKAPKEISDSPKNRRLSVYSFAASLQRRVEIIGIDINGEVIPIPFPVDQK